MSAPSSCDKERLIAYLYDEDGPAQRHATEAHLATCASCARELSALRGVRQQLASWETPEIDLGFRITREPIAGPRERAWWPLPAWAQAAAALIVLIGGAALANVDVQYGGFSLRVGWDQASARAVAASRPADAAPQAAMASEQALRAELEKLARELRGEIDTKVAASRPSPATGLPARADREALMGEVRSLVADSERRQQRELAFRLAQAIRDFDRQRQADLVRIEQNFGQLEGLTGAEAARQRELLNYLVRVSQQR